MIFFGMKQLTRHVEIKGELPSEASILKQTIQIAWPSIVESFLICLVGMIDTMMVGILGPVAIAAVGLTTQPKFIGLAIFMSLCVAISAIVAHRRGEKDAESARRVLVQSLVIVILLAVIISAVSVIFAEPIMRLAGAQDDTHADAALYFRIIMGGMLFNVISMTINAAQRGAGNTRIAMRTNMVSNAVNVVFNYLLIGGNFGFPRLGVMGAAIATVLGSIVACGMSIASVCKKDTFLSLRGFHHMSFDRATLWSLFNIGSSTLAEQVFLRIGFLMYAIIIAKLGTIEFATHQIGMNIMSLSFSLGDGLSTASVALVGRSLGERRPDLARIYARVCQRIGVIFSLIMAVLFTLLGRFMFALFTDDAQVLTYGVVLMRLMAVIVFFQIPQVIFSGCLRGSGDTKYTAFVSLVSVALVRPGMGWLFCYPLGLGLIGAWIGFLIDQIARCVLTWARFRGGKWMSHRV